MRIVALLVIGLAGPGLLAAGCSSCSEKKPAADAAVAPKKEAPKPAPVAVEPEAPTPEPARPKKDDGRQKADHAYVKGEQVVTQKKPLNIQSMPPVTREDLADPRLNDKLPIGSKRTIKILQKITEQDPRFKKKEGDPNYTPPPDK